MSIFAGKKRLQPLGNLENLKMTNVVRHALSACSRRLLALCARHSPFVVVVVVVVFYVFVVCSFIF